MRKQRLRIALLISSLFFFSIVTRGQLTTDELLSKVWQFKMSTRVVETDKLGNALNGSDIADRGYQFRVINIADNGALVIRFLYWNLTKVKDTTRAAKAKLNERFFISPNNRRVAGVDSFRYFVIERTDFDLRCEEKLPTNQFSVGAMTLPMKLRFGQKNHDGTDKSYSSFTGNISVGLSFGVKHNYSKTFALSLLGGFSLSSIPVSAETTNNFVEDETNQAAITWHAGFLAEFNNFQIGLFTGVDYLSGKINKEWVYKNKPWLGVGIGFSFFNAKKTTDTQ